MSSALNIAGRIKSDIVHGRLKAGQRLPSRERFLEQYGGSKSTIQRAMDDLVAEGFLVTQGRSGTYVSTTPPHLYDLGLVLRIGEGPAASVFHQQILRHHRELAARCGHQLRLFYVDPARGGEDDFAKLADMVQSMRLGGVILPFHPERWMIEPFLQHPAPVVALTMRHLEDAATAWLDYEALLRMALQSFRAEGRQRVGMIASQNLPDNYVASFERIAGELGLETRPYWIQGFPEGFDAESSHWLLRQLAAVLAHAPRPDALLVADERFLELTQGAMQAAGLAVGDVALVAQATFPLPPHPRVPGLRRLGFDVFDIVEHCVRVIVELRQTGQPGPCALVPAKWEEGSCHRAS